MHRTLTATAAAGVLVLAFAFRGWIAANIGVPPYASAAAIAGIAEQIEVASQSILWLQYENALRSGDRAALIRACNALIRAGYARPAGCP